MPKRHTTKSTLKQKSRTLETLIRLAKRAKALNADQLMQLMVADPFFIPLVIDLNTKKQLYEQGVDADGNRLRSAITGADGYAAFTIRMKEADGLPTDHFTLYQEGDFYASFRARLVAGNDLEITADTQKPDGDLADIFGPKIIGLTEESLTEVIEFAKETVIPIILKLLLAA